MDIYTSTEKLSMVYAFIEQIAIVYAFSFVVIYILHSLILRNYRMTKINFTFVLVEQILFAAYLSRGISTNCLQARPGK